MRKTKAGIKVLLFGLFCLLVISTQTIVLLFTKGPKSYILPHLWYRAVCYVFGIRIRIKGTPFTAGQVLYMSNHLSYMDIPAIGCVIKASFVSKSEVKDWPLFGFLSTLQQTAFVERKRTEAGRQKNALQSRIEKGDSLIIFPEGTSTNGLQVIPFKSSLFALALLKSVPDLYIQPLTINVLEVDGHAPDTLDVRNIYAWPREMDTPLPEHLWRFAQTKGAVIELVFHDPLKAHDFENRKVLAKTAHERVSMGLTSVLKDAA